MYKCMVKKIVQVPVEFQTCTRMPDASCCVTCNVIILQTTSVNAVFHYVRFARAGGACFESRKFFNSQDELNNALTQTALTFRALAIHFSALTICISTLLSLRSTLRLNII